ncbi:hypothetical protein K466DRAFT_591330 [Polyporus arcularius HHB13444]|uniref:Uncharacterized protein n=1 Tax=Polyporus arcularius HHB13444 TaxID=1314778 RepID=A0A5C3NVE5_9APHY|nr:hypothetical protein K466DRAFT_591330 [Polyporus arcularius HHB13444]
MSGTGHAGAVIVAGLASCGLLSDLLPHSVGDTGLALYRHGSPQSLRAAEERNCGVPIRNVIPAVCSFWAMMADCPARVIPMDGFVRVLWDRSETPMKNISSRGDCGENILQQYV